MGERRQPEIVEEQGVPLRRLADPDHLRAVAHPRRLAIIDLLLAEGPLTATACAERLGDSPASCSYHLRQLARFGVVEEAPGGTGRQRPWRWVPIGNRVELDGGPAEQAAAVEFLTVLDARNAERVDAWRGRATTDPWRDVAGSSDWVLHLTEDELRQLGRDLDAVLKPYQRRLMAGERPPGSRPVDVLVHLLRAPRTAVTTMRDLLRHRDFRLLLAGQTATMFGDWTLLLVFGIWGKSLTGSDAVAGLMIFAMAAPGLLGPLGGVVADRLPRRRLIIALDLVSVPIVLSLWAVHDRGQLWLLFAVAVWYGLSSIVVASAMSGLVQSMLPPALVGPANGALTTVRQGLRLVGPLVGAGLYAAVGGAWVATIDAATFVLGALALAALRHPEHRSMRAAVRFRDEVGAGIAHVVHDPVLRRLAVCEIGVVAAFGVTEPVVYALVDGLHRPPTFLGVLVAAQGVGAIVGGVLATGLVNRIGDARLLVTGLALLAAGVATETVPSLPPAFTGFLLFGAGLAALQVAVATMLQHRTPNAVMGRTAAAFEVIASVPYTASIGLGAAVVGLVDYRLVFALVAAALVVATFYGAVAIAPRAVRSTTTGPVPEPSLH